jgi:hypothetical protein
MPRCLRRGRLDDDMSASTEQTDTRHLRRCIPQTVRIPHPARHLHPLRSQSHSDSTRSVFLSSRISTDITSPLDADVELPLQAEQRLHPLGRHNECSSARREPCLATAFDHPEQWPRCHPSEKAHRALCAQALSQPSKASSCSSAAKAHWCHQTSRRHRCPVTTRARRRSLHLQ